jgi:outer membrane protein W
MKKLFIGAIAFAFMCSNQTNAQTKEGLFFSVNAGYNFAANTASSANTTRTTSPSNLLSESAELSFGKGINFGGSIGYMFNKNVGAELGIDYLIGSENTITDKQIGTGSYNDETKLSAKMLRFKPTLIISAGMDKINPYAKFGMIIGSGSISEDITYVSGSNTNVYKFVENGGVALGFHSALGVDFGINEKMAFFAELTMVNMAYAPKKGEITVHTRNGVDMLPTDSVYNNNVDYVDSVNSSTVIPSTSPRQELKRNLPFGSFGINLGLKYSL